MSSHLLQIKVEPSLKEKLQRIALSKGLNMTSYIKMTLIEVSENDADLALTENGFTVREERRLLKSIKEVERVYPRGDGKIHRSMKDALKSLD
jgi:antitoxin component of RelBE/YafQ-DinJ toxin-antitoxin module